MTKKMKWGIGIVILLAIIGFFYANSASSGPALEYETTTMSGATVRTLVSVVGSVKAEKETSLAFARSGTIAKIAVREGDKVSSGSVLAELDRSTLMLEIERARAALSAERSTLDKTRAGASSADQAVLDTNIRNAQVAIDTLRTSLAATKERTVKEVEEARLAYNNAKAVYESTKTTTGAVNAADIRALEVALGNAKSALAATEKTNTQNISASEGRLAEAKTALANAQREFDANTPIQNKNLADAQERSFYDASKYMDEVDRALRAVNDIITVEDYNKDTNIRYRSLLGVQRLNSYNNTVTAYYALRQSYQNQKNLFDVTGSVLSYTEILKRLDTLKTLLDSAYTTLSTANTMLEATLTSVDLSQTALQSFRDATLNQRAAASSAISALSTIRQNIENLELQKASSNTTYQNRVTAAQAALASAEQGVAGARAQADAQLISAKSALSQSEESLIKARAGIGAKDVDIQRLQNSVQEASQRLSSSEARLAEQIASSSKNISDLEAQLRSAEAQKRAQGGPARPEDIRVQESRVKQAEVALQIAESSLDDAFIRAPKEGIVAKVQIKEGEQASPSLAAISLIADDFSTIETNIAENEIAQVKPGQQVDLTFDAFPSNQIYKGTVTFINPAQTALDGVIYYRTEISFDPLQFPENVVRPGFSANLDIVTQEIFTTAVPVQAVKSAGQGKRKVEVLLDDGKTKKTEERIVETGLIGDEFIEILSGLTADELVVLSVIDPTK